jgi:hypothetical protein
VRDAHHAPAARGQVGVPRAVALEGGARAVMAVTVGLDDEPLGRPAEVDLEAVDPDVDLRLGEAVVAAEGQELRFEGLRSVVDVSSVPASAASRGGSRSRSSSRLASAASIERSSAGRGSTEERSINVCVGVVTMMASRMVLSGGLTGRWTMIARLDRHPPARGTVTSILAAEVGRMPRAPPRSGGSAPRRRHTRAPLPSTAPRGRSWCGRRRTRRGDGGGAAWRLPAVERHRDRDLALESSSPAGTLRGP